MSVELHPNNVLSFQRPLTQVIKRTLSIQNPQTSPVAFKVKTTAPKQYCVRPNAGRIEPGEQVEVQVLLQGMKEEPPADYKCKDKFLIQSALVTSEFEGLSLSDLWSSLEKENKANVHEQKIRCAFLPAEESAAAAPVPHSDDVRESAPEGTPSKYTAASERASKSSPSPSANGTPASARSAQADHDATKPFSQIASDAKSQPIAQTATEAKDSISAGTVAGGAAVAAAAGAGAAAVASVPQKAKDALGSTQPAASSSTSSSPAELQKMLNEARAEIERLRVQLKKTGTDSSGSQKSVAFKEEPSAALSHSIKEAQVEGVALDKVVMISAIVFVVTWLFF